MSEDVMSDDATEADLRALLEDERDALSRQLGELSGDEGRGLAYDPNFADSSQVTAERGEAGRLVGSLREALADVERALSKLDDGAYGRCERCGRPIAATRLEAMPAARYCIDCAAAAKRR